MNSFSDLLLSQIAPCFSAVYCFTFSDWYNLSLLAAVHRSSQTVCALLKGTLKAFKQFSVTNLTWENSVIDLGHSHWEPDKNIPIRSW